MGLDVAIVLQARMGSTRLPAKALARVGDDVLLSHCLERLVSSGIGPVVLATTTDAEDDVLAAEARKLHVWVVRGDRSDVLSRFSAAARTLGCRFVVRATGDNPAVDIDAPRRAVQALCESDADYCCETLLPVGAAVEAMKTTALLDADRRAMLPADREHVTPFIRRERARYKVIEPPAPLGLRRPDLRLSVDTFDDLEFMRAIARRLTDSLSRAPLGEVIGAADAAGVQESVA